MKPDNPYRHYLDSPTGRQWRRIGTRRRAGIASPLFSVYSKNSIGVGELPDLKLLADWASASGLSILQLLPMNDVGFNFRPYDAESSFALEAMHLSLTELAEADLKPFRSKIRALKDRFPTRSERVDTGVKSAKLELFREIFDKNCADRCAAFRAFKRSNAFWLGSYAHFKALKKKFKLAGWQDWLAEWKTPNAAALARLEKEEALEIEFQKWLQWQLFLQFAAAKKYATSKKVLLMGDLPFLVARDSADVWANQSYFKLELAAGAPPDLCFAQGQKWGMPPYSWENIAAGGYDYLTEKLRYAANFYDLFRIDHFVGIFRLWSIRSDESGDHGFFDPPDEAIWEAHGKKILREIIKSRMLPCAEDLGTVPDCSPHVLSEFAVPGMDVQRWMGAREFRPNAIAVISTHDLSTLRGWWEFEAGTVDEFVFQKKCENHGINFSAVKLKLFDPPKSKYGRLRWRRNVADKELLLNILERPEWQVGDLIGLHRETFDEKTTFWRMLGLVGDPPEKCTAAVAEAALRKIGETPSIFSIQLLQDWLSLGALHSTDPWTFRINFPGTTNDQNWTMRLPLSLEEMLKLPINKTIRKINSDTNRV